MAQIVSRGGGTPFGPGVVTVAELLSRIPMSRQGGSGSQTVISVAALLRREGRVSHLPDVDAGSDLIARVHSRRATARRGAIAAGTLLAAGSVVGVAVIDSALSAQNPPVPASEQGAVGDAARSTFQAAAPLAPLTTLSQDAQVSPLDAGKPAPGSWMNVAFPDTVHKPSDKAATGTARTGTGGAGTGSSASGPTAGSTTVGQATAAGSTTPVGTPASRSSSGSTTPGTGATTPSTSGPATGDSVTGRLGGALTGLGSGTPLAPVTGIVGGVVTGVGDFLGAVVHGGTAAK